MTVWRPPAQFNHVQVSRDLLHETLDHLDDGLDREAIAYWAGTQDGEDLRATRLVKPTAYRGRRFVFVPVEEVSGVVNECISFGDFLVVQLHTHPADEDHSEVDECGTVSKRDGFVSLVLPFYARSSTVESPSWFGYQLVNGVWANFDMGRVCVTD
jgi:proteasome lid subunit RPN8/RPN11